MTSAFKKVAVFVKPTEIMVVPLQALIKVIEACGAEVFLCERSAASLKGRSNRPGHPRAELGAMCDLAIVLGGDGTILGVARKVVGLEIPLVCINFGRVGFLSDIEPEDWEKGLEEVLDTDYCRRTTALAWQLTRYGHVVGKGFAVNDVVLSRAAMARLVCADIFVNNELMGSVRADGFLLSTPIGSSGYSVGAGGPLLSPEIRGVAFVPICPFLNTIPPMVFPCATIFRFELKPGTTESYLTVDGQEGQLMQTHDILEVQSIADAVLFKGRGISFLERLRTRSFILADPVRHRENTQS